MKLHSGKPAGLVEPLDKRVVLYLKEIIRNSCRRVKEFQSRGSDLLRGKVFHGVRPPESLRSKFNPNQKKVHNLITRTKLKYIIPKLIQKILLNKQRNGQDGTKSSFHRGMFALCVWRFVLEMIEAMNIRQIRHIFYLLRCLSSNALYYFQR